MRKRNEAIRCGSAGMLDAILPKGPGARGIGQATRSVQGRVLDSQDKPQPNAVVYLQNEKSLEVKTYIATADGSYRFGQLGPDVDYQLWAKYQGLKSKTRSISSFDSKKQFNFDLKLEPAK
jgi:Carboxypeptidase regulatory-like domain